MSPATPKLLPMFDTAFLSLLLVLFPLPFPAPADSQRPGSNPPLLLVPIRASRLLTDETSGPRSLPRTASSSFCTESLFPGAQSHRMECGKFAGLQVACLDPSAVSSPTTSRKARTSHTDPYSHLQTMPSASSFSSLRPIIYFNVHKSELHPQA